MELTLATVKDFSAVRKYDSHIPSVRLSACINENMVYALREGSEIIGILRFSLFWQTIPFLDLLFLDEAHRGKGYGRKAMAQWEQNMADLGHQHVMLSTQEDETAKYFYEKLGYRPIGAFLPPEQEADELMYAKALKV